MKSNELTLNDRILLSALEISSGDLNKLFTVEELLVKTWESNKQAFGLRGYEESHPDSNKIFTKIDGKDGLVAKGLFTAKGERILSFNELGLSQALRLNPDNNKLRYKLDRELQIVVNKIIQNSEFRNWLKDPSKPKHFRGAAYFWDIAPGTPSKTAIQRVNQIEKLLLETLKILDERKTNEIIEQHGKVLFERKDLERGLEFHNTLKKRFSKELETIFKTKT